MIQRFIYETLKGGLDAIQDDLTLLDDVFTQFGLPATELAAIRLWFQNNPPKVKHQYARTDDDFPLYSIVLGNERETDLYIGNDGMLVNDDGFLNSDDPDFGADLKSSVWQHTYEIMCYSEHPDGTSYLYEVAKAIFVTANWDDCGLFETAYSGADLAPDPRFVPEHLFARRFQLSGKREFERLVRSARLGKAFKVRGIHIDKSGSPSDIGDVRDLVTVGSPEDLTDG